jgi:hypothetical protein
LKHDNGFVAYLNGTKVAEANVPPVLGWFSTAPDNAPSDRSALEFAEFDLSQHAGLLQNGANVLAIHLMNNPSDNADQPATWAEGDWNGDGLFDHLDVFASLRLGNYVHGP